MVCPLSMLATVFFNLSIWLTLHLIWIQQKTFALLATSFSWSFQVESICFHFSLFSFLCFSFWYQYFDLFLNLHSHRNHIFFDRSLQLLFEYISILPLFFLLSGILWIISRYINCSEMWPFFYRLSQPLARADWINHVYLMISNPSQPSGTA